jgi:membrane fusion protein, hemolysin D
MKSTNSPSLAATELAYTKPARSIISFFRRFARGEKHERDFLPAALEIVETPPSPVGRAVVFAVILVFCIAIAWASLGKIDIVASAPGKIVPSGRTKVIQPFEIGVVRAIHVRDGQSVKANDPLIELDPTISKAESEHLLGDLIAAQIEAARLRAALSNDDDPSSRFQPPESASPTQVAMQRQYLINQVREQRSKLAALEKQRVQKQAERDTIGATIEKLEATIPLVQERADIRQYLSQKELTSKLTALEAQQLLVEQQRDLIVQRSRYREAEAALAAITEMRDHTLAEYQTKLYGELAAAEQKAAGLAQDLAKAAQRTKFQLLIAPVDGVVQQLAVHTIGGVVTPAQALLVLVPSDAHLEIEAMVSNRDIGFIRPGQEAEIKVDTFPFTRYGLLHGKVLTVSQDSIVRPRPQDKSNDKPQGAESSASEPKGEELVYAARVSLDRSQMQVDENLVNLSPGMAVTVEIKTGSRTVMSYLLSPVLRYKQESLRER